MTGAERETRIVEGAREAFRKGDEVGVDRGVVRVGIRFQHESVVLIGMEETLPPPAGAHDDEGEAHGWCAPAVRFHALDDARGDPSHKIVVERGERALQADRVLAVPHQRRRKLRPRIRAALGFRAEINCERCEQWREGALGEQEPGGLSVATDHAKCTMAAPLEAGRLLVQERIGGAERGRALHHARDGQSRLTLEHHAAQHILGIEQTNRPAVLPDHDRRPRIGGAQHGDRSEHRVARAHDGHVGLHRRGYGRANPVQKGAHSERVARGSDPCSPLTASPRAWPRSGRSTPRARRSSPRRWRRLGPMLLAG